MKKPKKLPDAELQVMQALWACGGTATRQQIETKLDNKGCEKAQTTILTELTRLADKGFVKVTKNGRSNLYTPSVKRDDYLAAQSRSFIDNLCGGSICVFATALCDSGISEEDLRELQDYLKERL